MSFASSIVARLAVPLLVACIGISAGFDTVPIPANFRVEAVDGRDKARLSWSSSASHVRIHIQKKLPNGTWETVSGFPRNQENTGRFTYDTPQTTTGTFKFWIRAYDRATSRYSLPTEEIIRRDMH